MNIQYIRLDETVCGTLNRMALEERRTVSEVVNEILRAHLKKDAPATPAQGALSSQKAG